MTNCLTLCKFFLITQNKLNLLATAITDLKWEVPGLWYTIKARADLVHIPGDQKVQEDVQTQHKENHSRSQLVPGVTSFPHMIPLDTNTCHQSQSQFNTQTKYT